MSISRHSKSAVRSAARPTAFTLIELLVVVAIIAVLISILLPSLRSAREQARTVVCGQRLRDLGNGTHAYFSENKDWIPGVNTSGFSVFALQGTPGGWNNPRIPVQTYDWITPVIGKSTTLKAVRAQRFKELLTQFHCPSQKFYQAVFFSAGLASSIDRPDFLADPRGWTALSYLQPAHFQWWGQRYRDTVIGSNRANPSATYTARTGDPAWEVVNDTYISQLTRVGNPGRKIAAADGTRYLDVDLSLDFDVNPVPGNYGSFTSAGGWWSGSTEYGVRANSQNWDNRAVSDGAPANGRNLELSYRHGTARGAGLAGTARANQGAINALFFDGSVQKLGDRQSRNPTFWYPTGSKVRTINSGMTNELAVNQLIP